jgi:hypothetical protein
MKSGCVISFPFPSWLFNPFSPFILYHQGSNLLGFKISHVWLNIIFYFMVKIYRKGMVGILRVSEVKGTKKILTVIWPLIGLAKIIRSGKFLSCKHQTPLCIRHISYSRCSFMEFLCHLLFCSFARQSLALASRKQEGMEEINVF